MAKTLDRPLIPFQNQLMTHINLYFSQTASRDDSLIEIVLKIRSKWAYILGQLSFTLSSEIGLLSLFQSRTHPDSAWNSRNPDAKWVIDYSDRRLRSSFISWKERTFNWMTRPGNLDLFVLDKDQELSSRLAPES